MTLSPSKEPAQTPLTPELALSQLGSQRKREERRLKAYTSGIRLLVRGAALGVLSLGAAYFSPPHLYNFVVVPLTVLAAAVGGFGALRLFAAFMLGRAKP